MRALVWRYVSAMHRQAEENPVTEDDINEVKGEVSAAKCEILEVLRSNGMDISKADTKGKSKLLHIFHLISLHGIIIVFAVEC
jgi:transient-receptor-potential-like protein